MDDVRAKDSGVEPEPTAKANTLQYPRAEPETNDEITEEPLCAANSLQNPDLTDHLLLVTTKHRAETPTERPADRPNEE